MQLWELSHTLMFGKERIIDTQRKLLEWGQLTKERGKGGMSQRCIHPVCLL